MGSVLHFVLLASFPVLFVLLGRRWTSETRRIYDEKRRGVLMEHLDWTPPDPFARRRPVGKTGLLGKLWG